MVLPIHCFRLPVKGAPVQGKRPRVGEEWVQDGAAGMPVSRSHLPLSLQT